MRVAKDAPRVDAIEGSTFGKPFTWRKVLERGLRHRSFFFVQMELSDHERARRHIAPRDVGLAVAVASGALHYSSSTAALLAVPI
jgi:hypothetical protein